jgi:hypothetical protein
MKYHSIHITNMHPSLKCIYFYENEKLSLINFLLIGIKVCDPGMVGWLNMWNEIVLL